MLTNNEDLLIFKDLLSKHLFTEIINLSIDKESQDYDGCSFTLNNTNFLYRKAKITPNKIGQFVTVWKRSATQITTPYGINDGINYYIICTRQKEHIGYFIFPIDLMCSKKIAADQNGDGGKRGFRVYPIWDIPDNKQATQTRQWQLNYFFDCTNLLADKKTMQNSFEQAFKTLC